ncbi:hypothetical protein [Solidesulfovibrio sp.]|uniref:hypothetical protein n=1 Tax=Solidesulfovibrio sp. TaxID=2910990 RepID=UPI002614B97B|nr:hypothetical protein [Solidesulfovibrio sp.]
MAKPPPRLPLPRRIRVFLVLAAGAGYPPAFLFAYFLDLAVPYGTVPMETNVTMPVFPVLAAILALLLWARYRLWRRLRRRFRGDDGEDAWDRFRLAHKPALLCLPVTLPLCFAPMEGNAFGFVVFPLLCLMTAAIGVWIQFRLWRRTD